jgi:hypothetical protein
MRTKQCTKIIERNYLGTTLKKKKHNYKIRTEIKNQITQKG